MYIRFLTLYLLDSLEKDTRSHEDFVIRLTKRFRIARKDLDLEARFTLKRTSDPIPQRVALIEHRVDIALNFSSFHLALITNLSNRKKGRERKMKKVSIAEGSLYTRRTGVNFSPTWAWSSVPRRGKTSMSNQCVQNLLLAVYPLFRADTTWRPAVRARPQRTW